MDYRCYLVTAGNGRHTVKTAAAAARAGAGVVQVRAKDLSAHDLLDLVMAVAESVAAASPVTRVLVNDRADIAYAACRAGAAVHGVHLGQEDLPVRAARDLLGPAALIGLSTGTIDLVRRAQSVADVVDYLGAGPFRPTPTKNSGRPALGVGGYPALVAQTSLPVVAIGDVTPDDVPALSQTGIAGVALLRAVMGANDPAAVVHHVLRGWESG